MNENQNLTRQINSFFSGLIESYNRQGRTGKIIIPGLFLLVLCCLCSITINLLRPRTSPIAAPSPFVFPSQGVLATPTALFNFGGATFTPFPTFPAPTPLPTFTPPPTATETATPIFTATSMPSATILPPTATSGPPVRIVALNKPMEYVDIQNVSSAAVDLNGWKLVSVMGNQSCTLKGVLQPNEVLRIWARRGKPGFSCRFPINIWNDNTNDPAVLYNAQGQEISRYP
jgi:hypothetical protein